jgi:CO/xanthine dehydrogenase Mo-binding subunit
VPGQARFGPATGFVQILRYCVVHDCGNMINPTIVEGQVHGGVAQGIGGALFEKLVFDEGGQLLTTTLADYLLPLATDIPTIETAHITTPSPLNPLGVKGAGEAGVIPCHAVLAAAIEDALGVRISEMPIHPSRIWEMVQR